MGMRILVVEDNVRLAGYIKKALQQKSYSVDLAHDGSTGEDNARTENYDLIILDIMLPGKDGLSVCQTLRTEDITTPIILLTARGELDDKVVGLDCGADDYLIKPFEIAELLARIRALLRRPKQKTAEILEIGDIKLDNSKFEVKKSGLKLSLTLKEYAILEFLIRNKGQAISREQILDHCWDHTFDSFSNIVDVYIKQLRKKLGNESSIQTIRGVGYKINES